MYLLSDLNLDLKIKENFALFYWLINLFINLLDYLKNALSQSRKQGCFYYCSQYCDSLEIRGFHTHSYYMQNWSL